MTTLKNPNDYDRKKVGLKWMLAVAQYKFLLTENALCSIRNKRLIPMSNVASIFWPVL